MVGGIMFTLFGLVSIVGTRWAKRTVKGSKLSQFQFWLFMGTHALLVAVGAYLLFHELPWQIPLFASFLAIGSRLWNGTTMHGRPQLSHQIINTGLLTLGVIASQWIL